MSRKKLENLAYKYTHSIFKGELDGERTMLKCIAGATCAAFLSDFTRDELLAKIPIAKRRKFG